MQKLKLEDLKPAPYNPRKIDERSKKALAESIKKFGDISGIVWNKTTGNLVCGHQRLEVLKQKYPDLKIEDNVIIAGGKKFPIRIVEWDIETEKLANIAANSQYVAGEFDYPKLDDILGELKLAKMDDIKLLRMDELKYPDIDYGDGFLDVAGTNEFFAITFTFHSEYKDIIQGYLKKNGKDHLMDVIVDVCKENH